MSHSGWNNTDHISGIAGTIPSGSPHTIHVRFNPAAVATFRVAAVLYADTSNAHLLAINNATPQFRSTAAGSTVTLSSSETLSADTWYSLVIKATSTTDRKIYVNGVQRGSSTTSSAPSSFTAMRIGANASTGNACGSDHIAEYALYNAALSDDDIAALAVKSARSVRPDALVSYLKLLDSASRDEVNLPATLTGTPTKDTGHPRVYYQRRSGLFIPKPGTSAVAVTAPKLSSASTLRAATVTPVIAATSPKLASASVLRAGTVTPEIAITAPKLSSASVLRAGVSSLAITSPKLDSASVLRAGTVAPAIAVTSPKLESASVLRAGTVTPVLAVTAPKLDSASVLRAGVVSGDVDKVIIAPKLASTSVLHAASVSLQVAVTAPHLASVSALYGASVAEDVVTPPAETPSTTAGGGGGGAQFYRGRYRHDIRKAIRRALDDLSGVRSSRSRKRRVRRIASEFAAEFAFDVPMPLFARMPDIAPLEPIRLQLLQLGQALRQREIAAGEARAKAAEMQRLFAEYEMEAARIERDEEEEALALILAIAA